MDKMWMGRPVRAATQRLQLCGEVSTFSQGKGKPAKGVNQGFGGSLARECRGGEVWLLPLGAPLTGSGEDSTNGFHQSSALPTSSSACGTRTCSGQMPNHSSGRQAGALRGAARGHTLGEGGQLTAQKRLPP